MLHYGKHVVSEDDIKAVCRVLNSDFLTQGPEITLFEKNFSEFVGAIDSVVVANGTAALHLAVMALGVRSGTRVLTSPITFAASSNCVLYEGAEVEFVDIDPVSFNMSLKHLEIKLSNDSQSYSGIIVTHFAGMPCEMKEISELAKKYNVWVIEDSSHALGGEYLTTGFEAKPSRIGSGEFADCCTFSFHPVKHIACGEGGMITTKNKTIADRLRLFRSHGIEKGCGGNKRPWEQDMVSLGYNYRISDINAALGNSQLGNIENNIRARRAIVSLYLRYFGLLDKVKFLQEQHINKHAFHLCVLLVEDRDELFLFLKAEGVLCQIHYVPTYRFSFYKNKYGNLNANFPNSEDYYKSCISIPVYPSLTRTDQLHVISKIYEFYKVPFDAGAF